MPPPSPGKAAAPQALSNSPQGEAGAARPLGPSDRLLRWAVVIAFAAASAAVWWPLPAQASRIKEVAAVQGVRSNALVGYGLVVGLDGSGDQTTQTPFTTQSLNSMLQQLGITVPAGTTMQLRNIAAVMVTAQLPPFARPGQAIDVVSRGRGRPSTSSCPPSATPRACAAVR